MSKVILWTPTHGKKNRGIHGKRIHQTDQNVDVEVADFPSLVKNRTL